MNPDLHNNFTTFLRSLSGYSWWQVAIQLLLIGAVVFWIIRFLEGTRGVRMLKGIAVVLIGFYLIINLVGKVFKLDPIIFLYEKVLLFASFALAVVFQPELRRALMRLGETRLFRGWTQQINEDIEQLVESATFLSRRKSAA